MTDGPLIQWNLYDFAISAEMCSSLRPSARSREMSVPSHIFPTGRLGPRRESGFAQQLSLDAAAGEDVLDAANCVYGQVGVARGALDKLRRHIVNRRRL